MSETLQFINIIVLVAAIAYAIRSQSNTKRAKAKQPSQEQEEKLKWERGAEIANNDREYMAFVNEFTGLGKAYDPDQWYYTMPESALKHLEVCFEGNEKQIYLMKRTIELSIEHFAMEMADDAECARIIEERVFKNPKPTVPFDSEEI